VSSSPSVPEPRPDAQLGVGREARFDSGPQDFRASDADRDRVLDLLREASAEGRLTPEEYEERAGAALVARTHGDLVPLTADLPVAGGTVGPLPAVQDKPIIAIMSEDSRSGRWAVPAQLRCLAVMGGVKLDLTDAVPTARETHLSCVSIMGDVTIIVPDGVDVRLDGTAIMGEKTAKKLRTPPVAGAPIIHVHAFAVMGSVEVKPKKQSGSLQRWLGRRTGPADHS
jgi:Domain of unknown function (DUF1707)/Cell wall-active antibiotics response 4TMS YvqF